MRLGAVLLSVIAWGAVVTLDAASGTHYASQMHWHPKTVTYSLTDSIPTAWRSSLVAAANTWKAENVLVYQQGVDEAYFPTKEEENSHLIFYSSIPVEWAFGCPPVTTLACVRWFPGSPEAGNGHLTDTDMVFNVLFAPLFSQQCLPHPPHPGVTTNVDVETLALHEFGHWAVLTDVYAASDWNYVMYGNYNGCQRSLHAHDVASLQQVYVGH